MWRIEWDDWYYNQQQSYETISDEEINEWELMKS